jgi:hypothetical protein
MFNNLSTFVRDQQERIDEIIVKIRKAEDICSYELIHQELLEKRLRWYQENKDTMRLKGSEVRKAYELLIEYLGLHPSEVPVAYEDERKIIWRSYNFCPVLEACMRLGLDTRKVCKQGWEKSVQELVSRINPDLRFSRNYEAIRPHAEYCEEGIELTTSGPL